MDSALLRSYFSVPNPPATQDLESSRKTEGEEYLREVSEFVSSQKLECLALQNPCGAVVKFVGLKGTSYSEKDVNGWGKFYLPDIVKMEVLGVVEGTSCPCEQLVLMTCKDRHVYGYDGEELHLVASSLYDLLETQRLDYPASKSYYNGEAFKDMTEEDWAEVKKGAKWKSLEQKHEDLAKSKKSTFLENLKSQK